MKIRIPKRLECLEWFLLFVLYYSHGAAVLAIGNSTIIAMISVLILLWFYKKMRIGIPQHVFYAFGLLLLNHILTGILSGANISEGFNFLTWLEMLFFYLGVYILIQFDGEKVIEKYVRIVVFFAAVSLICYLLISTGFGNILYILFKSQWGSGTRIYHGKWLYAYCEHFMRNNGVFYEPGVTQIPLVMSLFVLILYPNKLCFTKKRMIVSLSILIVTLITTKSTTAYIGLIAIILGYFFKKKEKKDIVIGVAIIFGVSFLFYDYIHNGSSSLIQTFLLDKLDETTSVKITRSSGGARLVAMKLGVQSAMTHPFGIGYLNWERQLEYIYGGKFGTGNALFTQLGTRGFLAFGISLYLAIMPAIKTIKEKIPLLIYIFLYLNITIAQGKILYPSIIMISFFLYPQLSENEKFHKKILI